MSSTLQGHALAVALGLGVRVGFGVRLSSGGQHAARVRSSMPHSAWLLDVYKTQRLGGEECRTTARVPLQHSAGTLSCLRFECRDDTPVTGEHVCRKRRLVPRMHTSTAPRMHIHSSLCFQQSALCLCASVPALLCLCLCACLSVPVCLGLFVCASVPVFSPLCPCVCARVCVPEPLCLCASVPLCLCICVIELVSECVRGCANERTPLAPGT